MDLQQALQTLVAVTVTPLDSDDRVDEAAFASIVTDMVDAGVPVVTANGNTGEFYALTPPELDLAVRLSVEAVAGRALVVAGVGFDQARAVQLARDAAGSGADAVMVHQPIHPYQSPEGWIAYHRAIADAVADVGVILYVRDPLVTGERIAALADACPNVVAVKYAVPDVLALASAVSAVETGRLAWLCGLAESWTPFFWLAGARGFTSGLATVAPGLSVALLRHLRDGAHEEAMRLWAALRPLEEMRGRRASADNVSVLKEALAQQGRCGRGVRPPSSTLSTADAAAVTAILQHWTTIDVSGAAVSPAVTANGK
jgi:4-hydroxy-tetrahydrodipicolinate synthase